MNFDFFFAQRTVFSDSGGNRTASDGFDSESLEKCNFCLKKSVFGYSNNDGAEFRPSYCRRKLRRCIEINDLGFCRISRNALLKQLCRFAAALGLRKINSAFIRHDFSLSLHFFTNVHRMRSYWACRFRHTTPADPWGRDS